MTSSQIDSIAEAIARMRADGLIVDSLVMDSELHRAATEGKERGRDGAYVAHADEPQSVWWLNWRTGVEGRYTAKSEKQMTAKERKQLAERIKTDKAKTRAAREKQHAAAARAAKALWDSGKPATDAHPYLQKKGVKVHGLRIGRYGNLLMPVLNGDGDIQTIQKITANGDKVFQPGGKKAGGYFPIPAADGNKEGPLLIAEGYATASTLHEATGHACLIALDAGNLMEVAKLARHKNPRRTICICADFDVPKTDKEKQLYPLPGGVGRNKAEAAAQATGACLALCPNTVPEVSDFNDLAKLDGMEKVKGIVQAALAKGPISDCPMPPGFSLRKKGRHQGLYYTKINADGTSEDIRLGPVLEILAHARDNDSSNWGLLLQWHDPDDVRHQWAMPLEAIYSQRGGGEWFSMLASGGWRGDPSCRKHIARYLTTADPLRRIRCVDRTGWHNDNRYVLPDATYGEGADQLVLQTMSATNPYETCGDMESWSRLAEYCVGNVKLSFALCAAFAGPLLRLANLEGGGLLFEGESSSGKTTALEIAASVWSNPGNLATWRGTASGIEGMAQSSNDNILILDELGQAQAHEVDQSIYMLANGAGKLRAARDGSLRKPNRWLALLLSSGELGLADKLAEDGKRPRAGQEVRFVGIPVSKDDVNNLHGMADAGSFIRKLKELAANNYGHAGRLFLEKLTQPDTLVNAREKFADGIQEQAREFCPDGANGQVMRVALRFALVGCAGALAQGMDILPKELDAIGSARLCFNEWVQKRGGTGAAEDMAILEQVKLFLELHGQSRFQDWSEPDAICINRVGFRRERTFYCLPEAFKREIIKGYALRKALQVLADADWLETRGNRKQCCERLPGMGVQRVYVLSLPDEAEAAADERSKK